MSGVDVGGDSSVQWKVFADNVRRSAIKICEVGDTGFETVGVDETDPGSFTITIKSPANYAAFVQTLTRAAQQAKALGGKAGIVTFELPIEDKNPDQIQIRWKSRVAGAPASKPAGSTSRGKGKKRGK